MVDRQVSPQCLTLDDRIDSGEYRGVATVKQSSESLILGYATRGIAQENLGDLVLKGNGRLFHGNTPPCVQEQQGIGFGLASPLDQERIRGMGLPSQTAWSFTRGPSGQ
jgi:hypothetical protein